MNFKALLIALVVSATFAATDGNAAEQYIYKWKDAQGMVHYTERPPAPGVPFEKVRREKDKSKSSSVNTAAAKNANNGSDIDEADDSYNSWRKENCKIAIQNLDVLKNASRISQDDGQGGKRLMTDEEKASKIKQMEEQKQKYCDPADESSQ